MLKDLRSVEEIGTFFKELESKPAGKIHQARIYGMAYRMQEIEQKEQEFEEIYKKSHKKDYVLNVTILGDGMAILEVEHRFNGENEIRYSIIVDKKLHYQYTENFDQAVLLALCVKYGYESFHEAIVNMLKMEQEQNN